MERAPRDRRPTTATDGSAGPSRPDPARLPRAAATRFAPAPTGRLHLGHLANALYVWGVAAACGGSVTLRIEDHDRERSRSTWEGAILDDLDALGLMPDRPSIAELRAGPSPFRQSDNGPAYADALERLRTGGLVYACSCARSTFAAWAAGAGRPWSGPGCPGGCRGRSLPEHGDLGIRVALGDGEERWDDVLLGEQGGPVAKDGDLLVRDRHGDWTYAFCVVVDDLRHDIGLVIRGADLVAATPGQVRLGRRLGRSTPPSFLHHPLIRKPTGAKLSKADGDTAVRSLLDAGRTPAELFGEAAAAIGLVRTPRPIDPASLASVFA